MQQAMDAIWGYKYIYIHLKDENLKFQDWLSYKIFYFINIKTKKLIKKYKYFLIIFCKKHIFKENILKNIINLWKDTNIKIYSPKI